MASLSARPSARKSRRSVRPQPVDVAGWLCEDGTDVFLKALARKYRSLSLTELDDLVSEITVALLERQADAPSSDATFAGWVDQVAEEVAKSLRDLRLETPGRGTGWDGEADQAVDAVVEEADESEPQFETCKELVAHEDRLRRRVRRQLAKLSVGQREAIAAKFFSGLSLNHFSADRGACDSADRMQLCRAKRKLAGMLTPAGYAKK